MKTINTVLPIYNSLSKQCFERAKKGGMNKPVPIITPQWRLPSFQWLDTTDGASTISTIELIDSEGISFNISMAFDSWTNVNFGTFTSSGLNITNAVHTGVGFASAHVEPDAAIWMDAGESLNIKCILTRNPGDSDNPISFTFYELGAPISSTVLIDGSNSITYTMSNPGYVDIGIFSNGASRFSLTEVRIVSGSFNNFFPTLPAAYAYDSDVYFMYNGDTLNYLLPLGTYYLKITMDTGHVYYSDWFRVECICSNLITDWPAAYAISYDTFKSEGTAILQATTATTGNCQSLDELDIVIGDVIRVITYITNISGGEMPQVYLVNPGVAVVSNVVDLTAGINDVELTATATGTFRVIFNNNNPASWEATDVLAFREYCEDYLQLTFSHSCNLGDIKYEDDFEQKLYLESEAMEPTFPYEEKGQENGYGVFVPTWQRQDKQYIIKTKLVPQFLVDVLHRLKLHDSITLMDNVGDLFTVEEIDVEHEWQFGDKYYAIVTLTVSLGEKIVVTGCCSAINECTGGSSTTCDEKYIKTTNLSAGVETDITTTLTDEPYNVMILDSSGNDITSLVTLRIGLNGGVYHFYVYSVDALSNVKFKVIY